MVSHRKQVIIKLGLKVVFLAQEFRDLCLGQAVLVATDNHLYQKQGRAEATPHVCPTVVYQESGDS